MEAIQKVKPSTNITLPRESPCKIEFLSAFYELSLLISSSLVENMSIKACIFPKDLTVLMLHTVSLIIDPTAFSNFYDFADMPLRTAMLMAPVTINSGESPSTIKVNFHE